MQTNLLRSPALTTLLATAVLALPQVADAVANDNFVSAEIVSAVPHITSASNSDATSESGEPSHYGSVNGHSVWWSWTATASGPMQVNTTNSAIRTVVGVYTGSAVNSLTAVSSGRGNHIVDFLAVQGTTYLIAVDSLDTNSYGSFNFRLLPGVPPPANDSLLNATLITGNTYTLSYFSNAGATKEPSEPAHAANLGGKSLWWKWTAPMSGPFQLETTGSTFNTLLAVYTGSTVGGLSLVASNDNFAGITSLLAFNATAGTEYRFVVDGWEGQEGLITLKLTPPSNDSFAFATVATGGFYGANGVYNTSATKEAGEPNHAGNIGGASLWWAWTAPASGPCHVDTIGSAFNTLLAVYTGTAVNNLTLIASNDDSPVMAPASELSFNAVGGTTYHIAVDGYNGATGWITMNLIHTPVSELILNGDFEAGNIGFSNDYLYSPLNMQPAGTYCVAVNPSSVHGSWASFGDHTTGTGLMLIANGDSSPTNVVWRQTINVSPNAAYLFSGWAASAHPASPGRFFLFVNGVQQGSVVDLPGTAGVWQNYSVIWSSGASASALLEIRMLTTESYGNDFVLDDLSFRGVTPGTPPPQLSIQKATGEAAVELSWPSLLNQLYQVQWAEALGSNQWFSLSAPLPGTGTTLIVTNAIGGNAQRFYRVVPVN